jgi:single-strand DNA-binding protein
MYINKVILYGNLTRDPEMRALPSGMNVCSFSIATNRVYKDRDGNKKEEVEYHNISAFGRQADTIGQYMKKGSSVFIEGRLHTRSWEKDGQKQYRTEVVADRVQFGPKSGGGSAGGAGYSKNKANEEQQEQGGGGSGIEYPKDDINPDDIPF